MPSDCRPPFTGRQVWPLSSDRNAPAAEIAAYILGRNGGAALILLGCYLLAERLVTGR
jgi:hypothetical protein